MKENKNMKLKQAVYNKKMHSIISSYALISKLLKTEFYILKLKPIKKNSEKKGFVSKMFSLLWVKN